MKGKIINDVVGFTGIGMLGFGIWQFDYRIALIIVGTIFLTMAIAIALRGNG